jgi:hypothetical protein
LIRQALAGLAERGARVGTTDVLTRLAEVQTLDGVTDVALDTIELALKENPEELVFRPNAITYRGALRLQMGQNESAEADFRDAITLAKRIRAKAWELRAAMSMAGCGAIRVNDSRPAIFSPPFIAGSPRASTRLICRSPKRS